jgi:hypothetical protein
MTLGTTENISFLWNVESFRPLAKCAEIRAITYIYDICIRIQCITTYNRTAFNISFILIHFCGCDLQ